MFVAGSRSLRTHDGRRGTPRCSSGRMARTVTVPPLTGVLIRARKVPETLPARYSVVAFEGTGIVVNAVQVGPVPDVGESGIGVVCGQHSMVICPSVTGPLPWILKVRKRSPGSVTVRPFPAVANACNAVVTFPVMALPSRRGLRSQMTPETAVAAPRAVVLHRPPAPVAPVSVAVAR
jgi:hypothetical protein